jgi:pilus assembly protein CpaB
MAKRGGAGGVIVVAIVLGVITAGLIYRYFTQINAANRENWQMVLVARQDIPARGKVTAELLKMADFPKERIAEGALVNEADAVNKLTRREIRAGDQIRGSDLTTEAALPGLSYKIPEGMRAIAIGAGEVMAVGASVQPGEYIDILANYQDPVTKQELTKILMQNVLVLAVNRGQTEAGSKEGGASSSMTLAVKPEDTELVMAMERAGALRVSLRPANDSKIHTTTGVAVRDLTAAVAPQMVITTKQQEVSAQPIIVRPPQRQRSELTVIRGTSEQVVAP